MGSVGPIRPEKKNDWYILLWDIFGVTYVAKLSEWFKPQAHKIKSKLPLAVNILKLSHMSNQMIVFFILIWGKKLDILTLSISKGNDLFEGNSCKSFAE